MRQGVALPSHGSQYLLLTGLCCVQKTKPRVSLREGRAVASPQHRGAENVVCQGAFNCILSTMVLVWFLLCPGQYLTSQQEELLPQKNRGKEKLKAYIAELETIESY